MLGAKVNDVTKENFMMSGSYVPPTDIAISIDDFPLPADCDVTDETANYQTSVMATALATQFRDWCLANPGDKEAGLCGP